ncbi:MAG: SMC family ATPase [Candidatus Daviesbacteria bacterium]|nr:SMC family ATPase [Candidatus Daviesbacteria bacterium]
MIPVKLKLSNFTSYADNPPELDFTKFKLAAISGLNGAGKSSLLDAITWCIWGVSRAGDSADSLIHSGANEMSVEFSFELDGNIYRLERKRVKKGGGSTTLEFWSGAAGSHNLTEGTIKATQEKIINCLHLTFETFTNSSYLRQGHADEFTTKGPTDRKRILADILGLSHYDLLEEKAKEKIKEIQSKLQLLEYQTLEIEAELSQKEERSEKKRVAEETIVQVEEKIKTLQEKIKNLQDKRETLKIANEQKTKLEQNFLQNKKELEEIIFQGKNRKFKIESLKEELSKLNKVTAELSELKDLQGEKNKLDEIKQKRMELEKELSDILGQINLKKQKSEQFKNEIEKLNSQLKETKISGAKCPTCGQEIGKTEKEHVHKNITDQIQVLQKSLKEIDFAIEEERIKKIESTLKNFVFDQSKYLDICTKLEGLEKAQADKEQMLKIQATLASEEKVVSEMRAMFVNKKAQVDTLKREIVALPSDLPEKLSKVNLEINEAEQEMAKLRTEEKEAQGMLGQINELISRTAQMENLKKQKSDEKSKLAKEKGTFEELALAFGKKGIQAMIIEGAIPEIEDEANKLLEKLTEGRMKITLLTQRETKTKLDSGEKGIIETLDIIISDEMGERPYEMYSGGEAFRVNFAVRLAISKLLTHRAGAKLQFLVIDEGFGSQDAPGRAKLVEAIDAIKGDFEKILVITHIEELKEEFPVRIEVSKNSMGSTFEMAGV